jgi:hypothetical protein
MSRGKRLEIHSQLGDTSPFRVFLQSLFVLDTFTVMYFIFLSTRESVSVCVCVCVS